MQQVLCSDHSRLYGQIVNEPLMGGSMMEKLEGKLEALILTVEENYAHARDHEHLRAQVTAILVAAAFVLIGLTIDTQLSGIRITYVAVMAILIGVLNVIVVLIHNNRFNRHVAIARYAKQQIATVEVDTDVPKFLSLAIAWVVVASLPIVAGIGLLFISCKH